jgi:ABC-2 type transport system ATP-binding protein
MTTEGMTSAHPSAGTATTTPGIVSLRGLRKVYDGKPPVNAIDGIDLDVREGEIYGLLGPNGAGKTTTISICTTRVLPTAGSAHIAGVDVIRHPSEARRYMGVVPQYNTLERACTVAENIQFHCLYFGFSNTEAKARTAELLDQFHLSERAGSYPAQLSGGLAQRVQIARAIAHRPKVLFLDEPSAGLDPQSRIAMWEAVQRLRTGGITVVLTTHYMEEADALCDRLSIVDHGRVLVEDTPQALKSSVGASTLYELDLREPAEALIPLLAALPNVRGVEPTPKGLRVMAGSADGLLPQVVTAATPYGLRDLSINEPTLETVFIRLTGRDLRE